MGQATLLPAIFGLIGTVVGALSTAGLTWFRERWFQVRKSAKDLEYLVIQVSCELERYVARCADVVADDGRYRGETDANGSLRVQVEDPKFQPELLKVEWQALSAKDMYEILDFPLRAAEAKSYLDSVWEDSSPLDIDEWFVERQYRYAKLGADASALAARLRGLVGLPCHRAAEGEWDGLAFMAQRREQIEQRRAIEGTRPSPLASVAGAALAADSSQL
ncbi:MULTISPECIES: hypothetical protein [unclassified Burkholderia]|uniref:hypothetical protein n=1 Tax=unclassified Burkholderia TaxID=2613784 RepID=UPI002AB0B0A3|nr:MULTISPECIES: hypothetical protein [unclassified Burkholderia]